MGCDSGRPRHSSRGDAPALCFEYDADTAASVVRSADDVLERPGPQASQSIWQSESKAVFSRGHSMLSGCGAVESHGEVGKQELVRPT